MTQEESLFSLLQLLYRAGQRADCLFASHLDDRSLTPRQYMVLRAVNETDGLSQTDITTATGIDKSTVAELARRLVASGLLKRRRTRRDARIYAVRITSDGRKAMSRGKLAASATEDALLSSLPAMQREAFLKALVLISSNSNQAGKG